MCSNSEMVTMVTGDQVIAMCKHRMKEIEENTEAYRERTIELQMTRHLLNWFPCKTREAAIARLKSKGEWESLQRFGWRHREYDNLMNLATLSMNNAFAVPERDAYKFEGVELVEDSDNRDMK